MSNSGVTEEKTGWSCSICTFENKWKSTECIMCLMGKRDNIYKKQPELPKFTMNPNDNINENKFDITIAIDFGTDGIALAYSINNKIYIHEEWANTKYGTNIKPKTIILLNENYEPLGFGKDAKFNYISMPMMKNKWYLFEKFKMSLYGLFNKL